MGDMLDVGSKVALAFHGMIDWGSKLSLRSGNYLTLSVIHGAS